MCKHSTFQYICLFLCFFNTHIVFFFLGICGCLWHSGSMKNKRSQDIFWETQASPPIGRYEVLEHDPRTNWNIKSFNKKPAVRQPRKRMSKAERVERMERSWRGGTLKNKKTNEIPFNASGPSPGAYNVLEADPRNNWSLKSFNIYRQ